MPVGSILTAKENAAAVQPLLLATITFADGSIRRLSSHDLSGAAQYGGNTYLPRVLNQEIAASQALAENGIDIPATVNLKLADPDYYLWTIDERAKGFKGSELVLTLVFRDVSANEYSSDSRVIFRGVCKEPGGKLPTHDGKVLTVGYVSRLMMNDITLPVIRVQKNCPWVFPRTLAERQAGADDPKSDFYRCGYSPDATGGNARGNLNGGSAFTSCNYSKADCVSRGMYTTDSVARVTGRFGGIQWAPLEAAHVRSYVTRKWETVRNPGNEARYGDRVPLLWGTARIEPLVLNQITDGNYTRFEALLHFGVTDYVHEVVVNGYLIPHTYDDSQFTEVPPGVTGRTQALQGGWWKTTNRGDRDGSPTNDAGFNDGSGVPQGDPYGSYAGIEVVVPRKVADAGSSPHVSVLCRKGVANPATQLAEVLEDWTAWDAATLNASSFTTAASLADVAINYTNEYGGSTTRPRFTSALNLRQPESAAEVIRGLRNAGRFLLTVDSDGKLYLRLKGTLADQQPSAVTGSNYVTAVSSKRATASGVPDGTVANGYVAYRFDETNVIGMVKPSVRAAGNRYSTSFQNEANRYATDAFSPVDVEDVQRMDQEIPAQFAVRGVTSYDQLTRLVATYSAEALRGNSRGDTGGSLLFEFEASFRCLHLSVGDICMLNWELLGLTNQLVRVERIQPETNFEKARLVCSWHSDDWYLDSYGQVREGRSAQNPRNRLARPSFAWMPNAEQPPVGDAIFERSRWTFQLAQRYDEGASAPLAKIKIRGTQIVNDVTAKPLPPSVPLQGVTASTGGTIGGGRTVYIALVAKDSAGKLSGPSRVVPVGIPSGTNTNTAGVQSIEWDAGTSGYVVYAGFDPNALAKQTESIGTPSSVTLTDLLIASSGMPDTEADRFRVKVWREWHGGGWGAEVTARTSTTITVSVPGAGFTANEWAGYVLSWLGRVGSSNLPVANWAVASNTTDTVTISGPDPTAIGLAVGDVVVLRSKPTWATDGTGTHLLDTGWTNILAPSGLTAGEEEGRTLRIFAGTGAGLKLPIKGNTSEKIYVDSPVALDSTTRYVVEHEATVATVESKRIANGDATAEVEIEVDVPNGLAETYMVQVFTLDGGDNESLDSNSPARDIYLFGAAPNPATLAAADGYFEMVTTAGAVTPDLADGLNQQESMAADVTVNNPTYTGGTIEPGMWLKLKFKQDATGGRRITWDTEYIGLANEDPDLSPDTYSLYEFVRNTSNKWELHSSAKGRSIT